MNFIKRTLKEKLDRVINRGKSVLLLGPRQTGKTTLIDTYSADLEITAQILGDGIEAISWRDLYQKLDSWIENETH